MTSLLQLNHFPALSHVVIRILVRSIPYLVFSILSLSAHNALAGKAPPGFSTPSINIPVRMALMAGYHGSTNTFKSEKEDKYIGGLGFGADFSVPFKKLKFAIGLGGWLVPTITTGHKTSHSMYLMNVYYRYLGSNFDLFIGPGAGNMSAKTRGTDASTNKLIDLESGIMGCAVTGGRVFFGKKVSAGVGLTGYYCMNSHYKKTVVDSSDVSTETKLSKRANSSGGLAFLFIEWNEERALL